MLSPHELLFHRKPRTLMPISQKNLQSRHPDNVNHQEGILKGSRDKLKFMIRKPVQTREYLTNGTSVCEKYHQENLGACLFLIDQIPLGNQELILWT